MISPNFDVNDRRSFLFLVEIEIVDKVINYTVFFDDKAVQTYHRMEMDPFISKLNSYVEAMFYSPYGYSIQNALESAIELEASGI